MKFSKVIKGNFSIEYMLVILFIPVILKLSILIIKLMSVSQTPMINQQDIFELQLIQLLNRSKIRKCDLEIEFSYDDRVFTIYRDDKKLIKTPGYEILLFDIGFFDAFEYKNKCNVFITDLQGREIEIVVEI